jgi:catechol 2,3-dioxygenase-like lactoylglutathione lyase family enzyme
MLDAPQSRDSIGISQVGQIAINVRSLDEAIAFYRDRLGLSFLFEAPGMAFFQCGDVRLMLAIPEGPDASRGSSVIYYRVKDIAGAADELRRRGVSFVADPHRVHKTSESELWMAFLRDPSENLLAIMEERRVEATVA